MSRSAAVAVPTAALAPAPESRALTEAFAARPLRTLVKTLRSVLAGVE